MSKTRPPKYCADKSKNKAFVRIDGKKIYLPGKIGSPESREAYARFEIEWWENSRRPATERVTPTLPTSGDKTIIKEVALKFLQYAEAAKTEANFTHYRIATMDFLVKHYGSTPADEFTAGCLHLIREAMIQSRRFCRKQVNEYTRRIVTLFRWGVSVGMVKPNMKVSRRVGDFYNKNSYRLAVLRAIEKANRQLPEDQRIPDWTPYELRHSAASAISVELGGDAATSQLGHTSPTTTAIYLHREVEKLVKLATEREKHNPFAVKGTKY